MCALRFPFALALATALELPASSSAAQRAPAGIVGRLVARETGAPIEGATIILIGTGTRVTTDSTGRFRYADLPPGAHRLEARAIGYRKSVWELRLDEGEQLRYDFELDALGYDLPEVVVEGQRDFERRRARGLGFFFTREEIERRHATTLSDLMRAVPGLQTTCRRGSCTIQMSRSPRGCRPEYYLDGFAASFSVGPDFRLTGIYGIEVYRTASETPTEFRKPELRCGVILIWSDMQR
jgi:carboxypeptidase family protein/TonB-dependent receptor-like protein